jgi:hypothetical protein
MLLSDGRGRRWFRSARNRLGTMCGCLLGPIRIQDESVRSEPEIPICNQKNRDGSYEDDEREQQSVGLPGLKGCPIL